jgi:hypothetical protein
MYFQHQHRVTQWLTKNPRLNLTTDAAGALLDRVIAAHDPALIIWTGRDISFACSRSELAAVAPELVDEYDHLAAATELAELAKSAVLQSAAAAAEAQAKQAEVGRVSFSMPTDELRTRLDELRQWLAAHGFNAVVQP